MESCLEEVKDGHMGGGRVANTKSKGEETQFLCHLFLEMIQGREILRQRALDEKFGSQGSDREAVQKVHEKKEVLRDEENMDSYNLFGGRAGFVVGSGKGIKM